MSSKADLPSWLQKAVSALPLDGQAQVADLYAKYKFDNDQLDTFLINHDDRLTMEALPALKTFLAAEEAAKAEKAVRKPVSQQAGAIKAGIKRKPPPSTAAPVQNVALASGARAALGFVEQVTPDGKRPREDPLDGKVDGKGMPATPDPLPKPVQVSLKSSVNKQLATTTEKDNAPTVKLLGDSTLWTGPRHGGIGRDAYTWMDEAIEDRAAAQEARLASFEGTVVSTVLARPAAQQSVDDELTAGIVGIPSQAEVVLTGRIACEGLEGRLNERSILLEGSRASSNGARVQLSLASCGHVAAFPGQIVGVLGRSGMGGTTFHARDFVAGISPQPSPLPRGDAPVHMLVVAGPYCVRDSLDFTPLEQVLVHAVRARPQVLILQGPFLAADNLKVSSGDLVLPNEMEPVSYEEVYTKHIFPRLVKGLMPLRRGVPATEVIMVPSLEEVLCFHPLPQPPLDMSLSLEPRAFEQLTRLGVRMVPNPAHMEINGLRVSICSTDALSPVLRELVLRPAERKIEEALRLLLYQRTLFPVLPRDPPQVSEARAAAFDFPEGHAPDVCIFPSVSGTPTGTFVDDTIFVNPGPLCRAAMGSFAEMWVVPPSGHAEGSKLHDRVRVDIQKLG